MRVQSQYPQDSFFLHYDRSCWRSESWCSTSLWRSRSEEADQAEQPNGALLPICLKRGIAHDLQILKENARKQPDSRHPSVD